VTSALSLVAALLASGLTAPGRAEPPDQSAAAIYDLNSVVAIPQIVGQQYCKGDDEISVLRLGVKFKLTNAGKVPAIVYLNSQQVIRVNVAADSAQMRAGNYQTEFYPTVYSTAGAEATIDPKRFVTIKPNETYSHKYRHDVPIPISSDGMARPGLVGAGRHVLRLTLRAWSDEPSMAETWTKQFAVTGRLRTEPVVAREIPLTIEIRLPLVSCK